MTSGALARVIRSAADRRSDAERCDLCGAEVFSGHRHLFETGREAVLCACRPCSVLFVEEGASEGRYRLVPRRRVRLPPVDTQGLGVPVGLAFFVRHADDTVTAHLPSPAGATRWEADQAAWLGQRCGGGGGIHARHTELPGRDPGDGAQQGRA
ncbi:DUF5947 family protein, partial [Streptomyces sp. NPDC001215]